MDNKLFIKFGNSLVENSQSLVFDIKNERFYVRNDFLLLNGNIESEDGYGIQIAIDGHKFYGIFTTIGYDSDSDEISDKSRIPITKAHILTFAA